LDAEMTKASRCDELGEDIEIGEGLYLEDFLNIENDLFYGSRDFTRRP